MFDMSALPLMGAILANNPFRAYRFSRISILKLVSVISWYLKPHIMFFACSFIFSMLHLSNEKKLNSLKLLNIF